MRALNKITMCLCNDLRVLKVALEEEMFRVALSQPKARVERLEVSVNDAYFSSVDTVTVDV